MFKQQVLGVISLSLPIIILFQVYPQFVFSLFGKILCALCTGIYVFYMHEKAAKNMVSALKYVPTTPHKEQLENLIHSCMLNPKDITLNYAYTNEMIAMSTFNNIIIDPLMCSSIEDDPDAIKVKDIFEHHIKPSLMPAQIDRLLNIKAACSQHAQRFIFRHELGHYIYNFSRKKLLLIWIIGFLSAYAGITAAQVTFYLGGIYALIIGMLVGGIIDLALTYATNILFKSREEKKADFFAARYSSAQEILAAADFFEKHQAIVDTYKTKNLFAYIPAVVTTGYHDGKTRACYLRKIAQQKVELLSL